MQVRPIAIDRINPAPYNPRKDLKPGDPAYEQLVQSLDSFGCVEPLVWNRRTGYLVGGHQRFKVLLARGETRVDVSVVDLDDAQEKALNLALNKITGEWDDDLLASLLRDLGQDAEFDFGPTGFSLDEIDQLIGAPEELDEAELTVPDGPAITQPGELIELGLNGEHRLLCGDATDAATLTRLLGEERAHLSHTDPPYGVAYDPRNRPKDPEKTRRSPANGSTSPSHLIQNDDLNDKAYADWFGKVVDAIGTALKNGGSYYIWNGHRRFGLMHDLLMQRKLKVSSTIAWAKESFSPGFGDYQEQVEFCLYGFKGGAKHRWFGPKNASTLWEVHRDPTRDYLHPTQKPLELAERAIRHSSRRGDLVFDPFLGSGTTLIAAARLGRRSVGLEIEPLHCDTIVRRYIALAGPSAVSPEVAERYALVTEGGAV